MGKQRRLVFAAALLGVFVLAPAPEAQTVKNGGLTGNIVSVSVEVPVDGSAEVYTTPRNDFFILTQFCSSVSGFGPVTLRGSTFGPVVTSLSPIAPLYCVTFVPGVAFAHNETLTCDAPSSFPNCQTCGTPTPQRCMITGVLSKK